MNMTFKRLVLFAAFFVSFTLMTGASLAIMPPHTTGTNIEKGTLRGTQLVIDGYSLNYTDVEKDVSIVNVATGKAVKVTGETACRGEGDCDGGPPGSCQQRCTLTVTIKGAKAGDKLKLKFLDLQVSFVLAAEK